MPLMEPQDKERQKQFPRGYRFVVKTEPGLMGRKLVSFVKEARKIPKITAPQSLKKDLGQNVANRRKSAIYKNPLLAVMEKPTRHPLTGISIMRPPPNISGDYEERLKDLNESLKPLYDFRRQKIREEEEKKKRIKVRFGVDVYERYGPGAKRSTKDVEHQKTVRMALTKPDKIDRTKGADLDSPAAPGKTLSNAPKKLPSIGTVVEEKDTKIPGVEDNCLTRNVPYMLEIWSRSEKRAAQSKVLFGHQRRKNYLSNDATLDSDSSTGSVELTTKSNINLAIANAYEFNLLGSQSSLDKSTSSVDLSNLDYFTDALEELTKLQEKGENKQPGNKTAKDELSNATVSLLKRKLNRILASHLTADKMDRALDQVLSGPKDFDKFVALEERKNKDDMYVVHKHHNTTIEEPISEPVPSEKDVRFENSPSFLRESTEKEDTCSFTSESHSILSSSDHSLSSMDTTANKAKARDEERRFLDDVLVPIIRFATIGNISPILLHALNSVKVHRNRKPFIQILEEIKVLIQFVKHHNNMKHTRGLIPAITRSEDHRVVGYISTFVEALDNEDLNVRFSAARMLYELGIHLNLLPPVFLNALKSGTEVYRYAASKCLVEMNVVNEDVIRQLVEKFCDLPQIREEACSMLKSVDEKHDEMVISILSEYLESPIVHYRKLCITHIHYILQRNGEKGNIQLDLKPFRERYLTHLLDRMWNDWDSNVRECSAKIVGLLGDGRSIMRWISYSIKLGDSIKRTEALKMMASLGVLTKQTLQTLIPCFSDNYKSVRLQACRIACIMKSDHREIINELIRCSDDHDVKVRAYAIKGLGLSQSTNENVLECIRWGIRHDSSPTVRVESCKAVQNLKLDLSSTTEDQNEDDTLRNTESFLSMRSSGSNEDILPEELLDEGPTSSIPGHYLNLFLTLADAGVNDTSAHVRNAAYASLKVYDLQNLLSKEITVEAKDGDEIFVHVDRVMQSVKELTTKTAVIKQITDEDTEEG